MQVRAFLRAAVVSLIPFLMAGCGGKKEAPPAPVTESLPQVAVVSSFPADGGRLMHLDHPVYVYLSEPVKPGQLAFAITPACGEWDVQLREQGRHAVLTHDQPFKAGQEYTLSLSVRPAGEEKKVRFTAFGPSSLEMIDAARKTGVIDENQAWTYRLQSVFEPDKLPRQFASPTPVEDADGLVRGYFRARPHLDPETARALDRYLKRPEDPESFLFDAYAAPPPQSLRLPLPGVSTALADSPRNPRPTLLFSIDCAKGPIKVWAPVNMKARAVDARNLFDANDMYKSFKELLGREPLKDIDDSPNGGDDRIDVYMLPPGKVGADGLCIPTGGFGQYSAAYIFIDWSLGGKDLAATLAHELFHAFQFNFDTFEDDWWMEATAVWSEDHIGKEWNTERDYLETVFFRPRFRMESINKCGNLHEYGIYLFPYHMSQEYDDQVIAGIWRGCESNDSLTAIDNALGFEDVFKEFALFSLDDGAYKGKYEDYNGPLDLFQYHDYLDIDLLLADHEELVEEGLHETITLPELGAVYVRVGNYLEEAKTPLVRFKLRQFSKNPDLGIQAVVDPNGQGRYEDWTGAEEKEFCLNRPNERFDEIALVLTNKNRDSFFDPELIIEVDAEGCSEKSGTATVTTKVSEKTQTRWEHRWPSGSVDSRRNDIISEGQASVHMSLEIRDVSIDKATNSIVETYEITSAGIRNFSISGQGSYDESHYDSDRDCTWETKKRKSPTTPIGPELRHGDSLSITFDLETGKAKWVALPDLSIVYNIRQKDSSQTSGCGRSDSSEGEIEIPGAVFALGPANVKSSEEIAVLAQPEISEIRQIAEEMKSMAENMQGMSYEEMEKFAEEFEKRHDTDRIAQGMERKLISPDLVARSGDGKTSIGGGGRKSETKPIENGTRVTSHEFEWNIQRQDNAGGN